MADGITINKSGNVYTLTKTQGNKTGTIIITDVDKDGLDNNDSIKFGKGYSLFTAEEINPHLNTNKYVDTDQREINLTNIDKDEKGTLKPKKDTDYKLGSLASALKVSTPQTSNTNSQSTFDMEQFRRDCHKLFCASLSPNCPNEIPSILNKMFPPPSVTNKVEETYTKNLFAPETDDAQPETGSSNNAQAKNTTPPATPPAAPPAAPPVAPVAVPTPETDSSAVNAQATAIATNLNKALQRSGRNQTNKALQDPGRKQTALKAAIAQITKDNVVEVMKAWDDKYKDKGLIQHINSKFLWSNGKNPHLTHIRDALADRAKAKGFTDKQIRTFIGNIAAQLQAWWTDDAQVETQFEKMRQAIIKKEQEPAK
jgi:hypothetical protein